MAYLQSLGLELERQAFHVYLTAELRETALYLTVGGQEVEVPADGLRGHRDDASLALRFDSDGAFNDNQAHPVVAQGPVVVVRSAQELSGLSEQDVAGRVVVVDYAVLDRSILDTGTVVGRATELLRKGPSGVVLITSFSNEPNQSHGAFVGDGSALTWVQDAPAVPALYARLEDLAPAGVEDWDDLAKIEAARLVWDADLFNPGTSGNLVAHIPGAEPGQAIILGAHIDSPNAPGAMDDGSGSAILLEVARVLDEAGVQPPADLYLAWFGSEELGLYGASHFVATHQELLDRTLAMLQIDCLTRPLDGIQAELKLVTWPYGRLGDPSMPWPEYLAGEAGRRDIEAVTEAAYYVYSDNSTFGGFDVPHADLIYEPLVDANQSVHYAGHLHDPYDTAELAREVGDVLEQMARISLAAALQTPGEIDALRGTPRPQRRAVFVASHTQVPHMSPVTHTELGMALAMAGYDVDLVPYGQAVTAADLQGADLVVALPVIDYALDEGALNEGGLGEGTDAEAWTAAEVDALEAYAAEGGLLLLTNSAHRLKYGNTGLDANEDWAEANALAERFGLAYGGDALAGDEARVEGTHPLLEGLYTLEMGTDNGLPLSLPDGALVLARVDSDAALALLDYGQAGGQVLALADLGMLTSGWTDPHNLPFWQNLARYAAER
jgi:hypothetical protein